MQANLQGLSIRTMSRVLERLPATVSRELALINLPDGDARFPAGRSKQRDAPGFSRNHLRAEGNPSGSDAGTTAWRIVPSPLLAYAMATACACRARGAQTDAASIHIRQPEVEDGLPQGHGEGDLIEGAGSRSPVGSRSNGYAPSHY